MADRRDYYFRQIVMEDELDAGFEGLEQADLQITKDIGLNRDDSNPGEYGGIMWGFGSSTVSGLTVRIQPGAAFDENGRIVTFASAIDVSLTKDGFTDPPGAGSGGTLTPVGSDTDPGVGNERWVTLYVTWDRDLQDLRTDGTNQQVYFEQNDSFKFNVVAGTVKTIGALLTTDKPARVAENHLLVDVHIKNDAGTLSIVSRDEDRKEVFFNVAASGAPNKSLIAGNQTTPGTIRKLVKDFLQYYNDHVGGTADQHTSTTVAWPGATTWADGTAGAYGVSTNVNDALNNLPADLKATTDPAGAKRIGAKAQSGSFTPANSHATAQSLTAGTLEAQLTELQTAVNSRVARTGDDGIGGPLTPTTDGTDLGTAANSWDLLANDVTVKGAAKSDVVPDGNGTRTLGAPASRWKAQLADTTIGGTGLLVDAGGIEVDAGGVQVDAGDVVITPGGLNTADVNSDLLPRTPDAFYLGDATQFWKEVRGANVYGSTAVNVGPAANSALTWDAGNTRLNINTAVRSADDVIAADKVIAGSEFLIDSASITYTTSFSAIAGAYTWDSLTSAYVITESEFATLIPDWPAGMNIAEVKIQVTAVTGTIGWELRQVTTTSNSTFYVGNFGTTGEKSASPGAPGSSWTHSLGLASATALEMRLTVGPGETVTVKPVIELRFTRTNVSLWQ